MQKLSGVVGKFPFLAFVHILDPIYRQRSVWANFYPLAVFGHVCGFLPFKNILPRYKGLSSIEFNLLSYPVLYSLSLNIILYIIAYEPTLHYYRNSFAFKFSTDSFALQFFFFAYSATKVSIHFFAVWRSPHILSCLKSLDSYDTQYSYKNTSSILNRYLLIFLMGTLISSTFNVLSTFRSTYEKVKENFHMSSEAFRVDKNESYVYPSRYWPLVIIPEPLTVTIGGYVTHAIAECAVFFAQGTIAFIVNCICERIHSLEREVCEIQHLMKMDDERDSDKALGNGGKIKRTPEVSIDKHLNDENTTTSPTIWIRPSIFPYQGNSPSEVVLNDIKCMPRKFIRLMDVCQDLNVIANEIIVIYTAGSTVIIVSLSYLIFVLGTVSVSGNAFFVPHGRLEVYTAVVEHTVKLIVILTIGRLLNFANTGEKLQTSVARLNNCMRKFDHTDSAEIGRICSYLWFLTSTTNASLSGGGFFHLNRSALTAIVAPVITFIVILAQFRVTDIQSMGIHNTPQ